MMYRNTQLPRFWECKVYVGDPDAKRPKTRKETVVAFNEVDVSRKLGAYRLAERPKQVCFVWREFEGQPWLRINDTSGPTQEVMRPSIAGD